MLLPLSCHGCSFWDVLSALNNLCSWEFGIPNHGCLVPVCSTWSPEVCLKSDFMLHIMLICPVLFFGGQGWGCKNVQSLQQVLYRKTVFSISLQITSQGTSWHVKESLKRGFFGMLTMQRRRVAVCAIWVCWANVTGAALYEFPCIVYIWQSCELCEQHCSIVQRGCEVGHPLHSAEDPVSSQRSMHETCIQEKSTTGRLNRHCELTQFCPTWTQRR